MKWELTPFESLYLEPSRNGLMRPKKVRGTGYKMINMGELFKYRRINDPDMERVPMNDKEISSYRLKPDDLLFARQSLVAEGAGKCSIVMNTPEVTTFESHLIRVRLDKRKAWPLFYYYYFRSPQGYGNVQSLVVQVAAAGIRGGELAKLQVPIPPFGEQTNIASILSTYDDLIENNTRRIAILEEMARRIYTEWFVHFRFPGYEKVKMVHSELGRIPSGWELLPSSQAVQYNPRVKLPKEGEKPFVPMAGLSEKNMQITQIESRSGNSGTKFQNGDTLFARITPCLENGKTGYVNCLPTDKTIALGSTEFVVMRSVTLCPEYVYCLARSTDFRENAIKSMAGASGRQRVRPECFDSYIIAQPDRNTLSSFQQSVAPMFNLINCLTRKNQTLRQTRDLLLPKLISGKIDVSEMEIAA